MRLHRLHIENFKAIRTRDLDLPDTGVVVVQGRNEVGKTSMILAFDALITLKDTSRTRDIREAKPVDRDEPIVVEAEFTVGEERVVYRKQWLKGPATTLRFVAGPRAGRTFTGGEAHDVACALWDSCDGTLWEAMRIMQASPLTAVGFGGSSVLRRALEAQAGGARMEDPEADGLVERVQTETDRYWTATRAKTNADVRATETALEQAATEAAAARAALDEVAETEDALAEVLDDQAYVDEQVARHRAERDGLAEQLAAVAAAGEAAEEAERTAERATRDLEAVAARHEQRADLRGQAEDAALQVERLEQSVERAKAEVAPARERAATAESAHDAAQEAYDRAREAERAATSDRAHLLSVGRLADLRSTLDKLDGLRTRISGLREAVEDGITQHQLAELERAVEQARGAEIALSVGSARVAVHPLAAGGSLLVDGEATEVTEPWERPVVRETTVEVPGLWRITVAPESATESRAEAVRSAQQAVADLLADLGVAGPEQARQRRLEGESAARALADAEADRTAILRRNDEASLRDEHERLAATTGQYTDERAGSTPLPESLSQAEERATAAAAALTEAQQELISTTTAARTTRDDLAERSKRLQQLSGELTNQRATLTARRTALEAARAKEADEDLDRALSEARHALARAEAAAAEAQGRLRALDADTVTARHEHASTALATFAGRQDRLRERRSELGVKLTVMGRDDRQATYDRAATALAEAERVADGMRRRAEAALLLERTLVAHQREGREAYVAPFRERIEELGRVTYGDPDFGVTVDDRLAVTERRLQGTTLAFEQLSTGAKEQLVILIRLATAMLVDPDEGVPVMFDDALGYSDRHRLQTISRALTAASQTSQVILFTCHTDRYAGLPEARLVEL